MTTQVGRIELEEAIRGYFIALFNEAKERDCRGDFSVSISGTGHMNSKDIKIEAEARIGTWNNEGKMRATSLQTAFTFAAKRATENAHHEVQLLTAGD